jgi:hypothetical protein
MAGPPAHCQPRARRVTEPQGAARAVAGSRAGGPACVVRRGLDTTTVRSVTHRGVASASEWAVAATLATLAADGQRQTRAELDVENWAHCCSRPIDWRSTGPPGQALQSQRVLLPLPRHSEAQAFTRTTQLCGHRRAALLSCPSGAGVPSLLTVQRHAVGLATIYNYLL